MAGVFISYRREDSGGWAGRLKDHLEARFGSGLVWQDVDDIPAGVNWLEQIRTGVEHADAVLIVIGPRWLELGRPRLQDPNDVLRAEIIWALSSAALVIPVLVGGARIPDEGSLPAPLQPLRLRQAATISDSEWRQSVDLVIESLREAVEKTRERLPLQMIQDQLYRLQEEFFDTLGRDARKALGVAAKALTLLDRQQPQYPQDARLQLFRGYFEKNRALAFGELGDSDQSAAAVSRAGRVFQVMRAELAADMASAYNGIGSVAIMERRFADAIEWIDKALELAPNYPQALHDREIAIRALGRSTKRPKGRSRAKR